MSGSYQTGVWVRNAKAMDVLCMDLSPLCRSTHCEVTPELQRKHPFPASTYVALPVVSVSHNPCPGCSRKGHENVSSGL